MQGSKELADLINELPEPLLGNWYACEPFGDSSILRGGSNTARNIHRFEMYIEREGLRVVFYNKMDMDAPSIVDIVMPITHWMALAAKILGGILRHREHKYYP